MKKIALAHNIPVYQPESINTPEGVTRLGEMKPELLVVAAYGQILSKDVLAVPPKGGINVHASLLPKYRGAAPINWAIYHGEAETGVTIIRMSIHLDAGEMLAREATPILPEETAGALEERLAPLGAKLALDIVDRLEAGPVSGEKQDRSQVTKAPKLSKELGLIDWSRSGTQVVNQIRAMQPWPTAYTFLHRKKHTPVRIIVERARSETGSGLAPGEIVIEAVHEKRLLVQTTDDTRAEILELRPAGKKRMSADAFLLGHALQAGDHFGPESA